MNQPVLLRGEIQIDLFPFSLEHSFGIESLAFAQIGFFSLLFYFRTTKSVLVPATPSERIRIKVIGRLSVSPPYFKRKELLDPLFKSVCVHNVCMGRKKVWKRYYIYGEEAEGPYYLVGLSAGVFERWGKRGDWAGPGYIRGGRK